MLCHYALEQLGPQAQMTTRDKPALPNVLLRPYQQTKHPFGKTVTYDADIRVPGEETAALFAQVEAERVAKEKKMPRKRKPVVGNNAEALAKTGQLAAKPLAERWQKRSNIINKRLAAYYRDRMILNGKFSYQDVAAVRFLLDPKQRANALSALVMYAAKQKDVKLQRLVIKAGLLYKVNAPLETLSNKMGARDLLTFLQNKAAVSAKNDMTNDSTRAQFIDLEAKAQKLKPVARRKTYTAMAEIFPHAAGAKILREEADKLKDVKTPRKTTPKEKAPSLSPLLKALENDLRNSATDDQTHMNALTAFDTIEEQIPYADTITQSKIYARLAVLHPDKATASFYYDHAIDTAVMIDEETTKAAHLQKLRDTAPDVQRRNAVHTLFTQNASFTSLVKDAVALTKKTVENAEMLKISHGAIVEQKDENTARKTFYQQHKQTLNKATLGWQLKW